MFRQKQFTCIIFTNSVFFRNPFLIHNKLNLFLCLRFNMMSKFNIVFFQRMYVFYNSSSANLILSHFITIIFLFSCFSFLDIIG